MLGSTYFNWCCWVGCLYFFWRCSFWDPARILLHPPFPCAAFFQTKHCSLKQFSVYLLDAMYDDVNMKYEIYVLTSWIIKNQEKEFMSISWFIFKIISTILFHFEKERVVFIVAQKLKHYSKIIVMRFGL